MHARLRTGAHLLLHHFPNIIYISSADAEGGDIGSTASFFYFAPVNEICLSTSILLPALAIKILSLRLI